MKARFTLYMATVAALLARTAGAGPWNIEPVLGLSADFDTNPLLLQLDGHAEEHVAGLIDVPLRYDGDATEFSVRPYGRISDSQGYSSLASNYAHLDTAAHFVNELGSTSVLASIARDSSLYFVGALVNGVGVERNTESTEGDWTRSLTERSQIQVDAGWSKVHYDAPSGAITSSYNLVDYRYTSAGPTYAYQLNELDTLSLVANYGVYQSVNGITESKSVSLQAGYDHPLNEIWKLSIKAGYSQSTNSEKVLNELLYYFYGIVEYDTYNSKQDGTVYSATISRQGERVNLSAGVSRSLQPTGFAFLSKQDSVVGAGSLTQSARWDYSWSVAWQKAVSPQENAGIAQLNGNEFAVRFLNAQVAANWHWTPQWVVTLRATRVSQQYGPPTISGASSGINLDLTRHFLRTEL